MPYIYQNSQSKEDIDKIKEGAPSFNVNNNMELVMMLSVDADYAFYLNEDSELILEV